MKYFPGTSIIICALNGKYPFIVPHVERVPARAIVIHRAVLAGIERMPAIVPGRPFHF